MRHLVVITLCLAVATLSSAAPVRSTRNSGDEGCGKGCKMLRDGSDLSRCVKNACRKHVFRYYMRVGKRFGPISSDPAFRHGFQQRLAQRQRQRQGVVEGPPSMPSRLQQWQPQLDVGQDKQTTLQDASTSEALASRSRNNIIFSPARRSSFHVRNLNSLYRKMTDTKPRRASRWNRVVVMPMTSSERRANQLRLHDRVRLPMFLRRLNSK